MSDSQLSDVHSAHVMTWENQSHSNLALHKRIQLFEIAIHAIERRASKTLSGVTLLVILDRVLSQSKEKFPFLSYISVESNSLNLKSHEQINDLDQNELIEALRYLLIELLRVLGRITADILTIPLHNELLKVSWNEPETK